MVRLFNRFGKHYPSIRNEMWKKFGQKDKYTQSKIYGWIIKSMRDGYIAALKCFERKGVHGETWRNARRFTKTSFGNRIISLDNQTFHKAKVSVLAMAEARHRGKYRDFSEDEMREMASMFDYLTSGNYRGHVRLDVIKRRNKDDDDFGVIDIVDSEDREENSREEDYQNQNQSQMNMQG